MFYLNDSGYYHKKEDGLEQGMKFSNSLSAMVTVKSLVTDKDFNQP